MIMLLIDKNQGLFKTKNSKKDGLFYAKIMYRNV